MNDPRNDPEAYAVQSMMAAWNHPDRLAERKIAHAMQRAADDMTVRIDIFTGALLVEVDGKCYAVTIQPHKTERERLEEEANRIRYQQMLRMMQVSTLSPLPISGGNVPGGPL